MKRRSHRGFLAAVAGASIGFALALLFFPRLPWRSSPGQLPGYAALFGFDPRGGELGLVVLVLLSLLGGAAAYRLSGARFPKGLGGTRGAVQPAALRTRFSPPRANILVPAAAAHALVGWTFLIGPAARHGFVRPFVLLAALIRYYEVAFYETEAAQREVIAAVEQNPRVRLVLKKGFVLVDGIPSETRAPLVAAFVDENFEPFYEENGIEWWLRKEAPGK